MAKNAAAICSPELHYINLKRKLVHNSEGPRIFCAMIVSVFILRKNSTDPICISCITKEKEHYSCTYIFEVPSALQRYNETAIRPNHAQHKSGRTILGHLEIRKVKKIINYIFFIASNNINDKSVYILIDWKEKKIRKKFYASLNVTLANETTFRTTYPPF